MALPKPAPLLERERDRERAETKPYNIFPRRHNNVLKYSSLSMNIKSDCCFNLREHDIYTHTHILYVNIFNPTTQCVQYTQNV